MVCWDLCVVTKHPWKTMQNNIQNANYNLELWHHICASQMPYKPPFHHNLQPFSSTFPKVTHAKGITTLCHLGVIVCIPACNLCIKLVTQCWMLFFLHSIFASHYVYVFNAPLQGVWRMASTYIVSCLGQNNYPK